jgi:hypothetical protein
LETAVALLIFNRADLTARVFEMIEAVEPSKLFVIADGARAGVEGEGEKCSAARAATEAVGWGCEVVRVYSELNLGCQRRVSSGLDYVFSQVDRAIILEDDCLPSRSFFRFCEELLEHYEHDERVMMISGNDFRGAGGTSPNSYYFTRNPHIWGWATWRRAWRYFDVSMSGWAELRGTSLLEDMVGAGQVADATRRLFDETAAGRIDTWDYQWLFALWSQHGLAVVPAVNLVTNLGFRDDATHTRDSGDERANLPTQELNFPLRHPPFMIAERAFPMPRGGKRPLARLVPDRLRRLLLTRSES